jgi:RNA polymerase sigma-70 factor (ECF subfamily)
LYRATAEGIAIASPRAFLTTVTTRLAIDELQSARVRREMYVGPWLPEPLLDAVEPDPAEHAEMTDSLSLAFLVVLETLSSVERAVFLLRATFEYGYDEIAAIIGKSAENCRQIFTRAKKRIDAGKPRFGVSQTARQELATRFFAAVRQGDLTNLVDFLANDVAFYGDGGGKAQAHPRPIVGRERVGRLLARLFATAREIKVTVRPMQINGQPGALCFDAQDRLINVMVLDIADGAVQTVRSIVNPDKLAYLGFPLSDVARIDRRTTRAPFAGMCHNAGSDIVFKGWRVKPT